MSLAVLALVSIAVLVVGYFAYGSFIARCFNLDDARVTPATANDDGVDFVPTNPFYLFGQHFSAIAAAGPIAGPILACMGFGWLPCVLWILLGVVFIGAVHDFAALVASLRHGAHSIAEIARANLGRRAYLAITGFIWLALLYVITAFTQITADTFVGKAQEFEGLATPFNKGGAVAMASALYLTVALVMGVVVRFLKPPMWLVTLVFVPATLGCVWAGTKLDGVLVWDVKAWYAVILVYCFVAAQLPMWLLQQPRGYLGGFVLYMALGVGVSGILFGQFTVQQPAVSDLAWKSLNPLSATALLDAKSGVKLTDFVFPFLFVTIACGACSGFHGLICGGTTSRQVARESHCKPVAFGAMLLEGLVAIIALSTVMLLSPAQAAGQSAARIYGDGLASFITAFAGKGAFVFAATFGAMAFSTFVFDTLDVSTRLGRYLLQELFGTPGKVAGLIAAGATAGVPLAMLLTADPAGYRLFWTLFGTSNQLLAALTLLGIAVWLRCSGRRCWYVAVPMVFVMTITLWALGLQIAVGVRDAMGGAWRVAVAGGAGAGGEGPLNPTIINAGVGILLLALAVLFVVEAARVLRRGACPPGSDHDHLRRATPAMPIPVQRFERTDSTSLHARRLVDSGLAPITPTLFLAQEQTGGVGRFARPWSSPRGGLWCTLLWPLPLENAERYAILDGLGLRVGVACLNAIRATLAEYSSPEMPAPPTLSVRLKWPNDIFVNNKKVLGVLCEILTHAPEPSGPAYPARSFVLLGVGVNANLEVDDLPQILRPSASTLRTLTGRETDLERLCADLTQRLVAAVSAHGLDPATLATARKHLARVGERVAITLPDRTTIEGTLLGLSDDGRLMLETRDGPTTLPGGAELL